LLKAGFAHVEIIDTQSDLNVYGKNAERESSCCGASSSATSCEEQAMRAQLVELMQRYNINDFAASVKVYAVKP
jgi:hypothetical protein